MTIDRLREILDAYGAAPERWPAAERDAALALLAESAAARALVDAARRLDALLDRLPTPEPRADADELAARIAAAEPRRSPPTVVPLRRAANDRLPWAWPSLAGIAAAAALGFWIGWSDPDAERLVAGGSSFDDVLPSTVLEESLTW
jgi:hypothetical protein